MDILGTVGEQYIQTMLILKLMVLVMTERCFVATKEVRHRLKVYLGHNVYICCDSNLCMCESHYSFYYFGIKTYCSTQF